jgi:radical SAM superfamily enzyme YgiQ (UPF0313 family)
MKVVLAVPPIMDYSNSRSWGELVPIAQDRLRECPAYGVYMLASMLRRHGHEVVVADLIALGSDRIDLYEQHIEEASLIGISSTSLSWPTAFSVIRQIRQIRGDVPIVLGGIHATMFDRYLLRDFPVQYVVRGEAEVALAQLCSCLETGGDLSEVPSLTWAHSGRIIRNGLAPKLSGEAMGRFALPDFGELPSGIYKGLSIESSRGCAFDCSFCSTNYRLGWRGVPAEQFVDRLERVLEHVDRTLYRYVHIVDDEFSMNPKRATEIAHIIQRRGLQPRLVYDSRAKDLLWDGYVESIAEFTTQFLVGAECGYDEGLKLIGKGTTCRLLEDAARMLERHGLSGRADFSFILGLPWETKSEVMQTIRFAMHLHATYGVRVLLQWYCQIPGSRLWEDARRTGRVTEAMYNDFGFFRDIYLFRSGVRLTPLEVWEIGTMVDQIKTIVQVREPDRKMIEFSFPLAIYQNFPRELWEDEDAGLASLREVSRREKAMSTRVGAARARASEPIEVGVPIRHTGA